MLERLIGGITSKPKFVILVSLLLMLPSAIGFFMTGVNYNLLSYLPEELDSIQGEVLLDKDFGCASMSFLIVENMPSDEVNTLKQNISSIDCVSSVFGLEDIIGNGVPLSMLPDEITSMLYSAEGNATLILISFSTSSADDTTMDAINDINDMARNRCIMSGLSAILTDTRNIVEKQAPIYIVFAIISALAMLTLLSESWIMPPIILYTLCAAVVYNMGTNVFFGKISYITECIAVVLQLAVTMDYSVFLIERYHEELEICPSKEQAMISAVKKSVSSLLGSALTTLFGFAALCFMSLTLGMDIGLVMIKGVVFGLLSVFFLLPALLLQFDGIASKYKHRYFRPNFHKINVAVITNRKLFTAIFFILMIPAFLLYSNINEYYSLDEMLGDDMPSISALNKLKSDFSMASVDFAIVDDSLPDAAINQLTKELESVDGIKSVISYGKFAGPAIPTDMIPESILGIVKNNGKQMIMMISEYTAGHDDSNSQINTLTGILKSYDPGSYITGEGPLTKDLVEIADNDFKVTTVISIAAILIIIAICLKSFTIPFILVATIELAVMINEGLSLITGSLVPFIAPAVVGCVQLGATVDYAILLTNRYRQELEKGVNRRKAMFAAANASDYSIFKSACVFFAATFSVYLICNVDIVKDLCLLLARGSIISAAIIIFLLTPLLVVFEPVISKTTDTWPQRKAIKKLLTDSTEEGTDNSNEV